MPLPVTISNLWESFQVHCHKKYATMFIYSADYNNRYGSDAWGSGSFHFIHSYK